MPNITSTKSSICVVELSSAEIAQMVIEIAQKKLEKEQFKGIFKLAYAEPNFTTYKLTFLQIGERHFKKVEPLDF